MLTSSITCMQFSPLQPSQIRSIKFRLELLIDGNH